MAHELTKRANGFVEMAFVGQTPWHKLGQQLDENSSIEQWQVAAGMDWTIESAPVQFYNANDGYATNVFEGQNVQYRSDNQMPLGIVSDRYHAVQPKEVLEFFRDLVNENGFKIHTAGTLRGGKRMWALAQTGAYAEVAKDDGVGGFLLLSTSTDKSLATTARFTTVRVVCNNTLSIATRGRAHTVSFSHISKFDHDAVKQKLGNAVESFGSFIESAKYLQSQQMTATEANAFLGTLFTPISHANDDDISKNRAYQKILQLFDNGSKGNDLVGHTKWGMLNAVTEYYDHLSPSRTDDERLNRSWFGMGERVKNNAVELLLAD